MARQIQYIEIMSPVDKVWNLLVDPKEFAFWAPNVRDLEITPAGTIALDATRHFRLDLSGKIETLDMRVTHFTDGESFAETPVGGSMKLHEKVKSMKVVYRVEPVDAKTCTLRFTLDYEMQGFLNKMLETMVMGAFTANLKLWLERLKTYAETGRPV